MNPHPRSKKAKYARRKADRQIKKVARKQQSAIRHKFNSTHCVFSSQYIRDNQLQESKALQYSQVLEIIKSFIRRNDKEIDHLNDLASKTAPGSKRTRLSKSQQNKLLILQEEKQRLLNEFESSGLLWPDLTKKSNFSKVLQCSQSSGLNIGILSSVTQKKFSLKSQPSSSVEIWKQVANSTSRQSDWIPASIQDDTSRETRG